MIIKEEEASGAVAFIIPVKFAATESSPAVAEFPAGEKHGEHTGAGSSDLPTR
jgi:hypothetical protein